LEEAAAILLAPPGGDEDLFAAARACRERIFGRRVGLFAPLYYSNVCANDCLYCGFRRSLGPEGRRILTPEEVSGEARALASQGHRRILLIGSEDPSPRGSELALTAVAALRQGAPEATVALEMAPRAGKDFARLADAGVTGYVLFQETYDRELYAAVHPSGPKADFDHRIDGPATAFAAGIRGLGLGVLYGLGDLVWETLALISHARELERQTGRPVATVSVPRLEPAEGVPFSQAPPRPVADDLWLRIVAVLRLALPRTDVIVSTREGQASRRASLEAGASVFSAGSRTEPGGYLAPDECRGQFLVEDARPLAEVAADLRTQGYEPEVRYVDGAELAADA
jgi:2-iminoacetate synthase